MAYQAATASARCADPVDPLRMGRPAWMRHGACNGCDPALFFPETGEQAGEAKAVCAACPVRRECLDFAVAGREKHGVWGGTTERERRRLWGWRG